MTQNHAAAAQAVPPDTRSKILHAASWICLGLAAAVASVAVAGHWAINAEAFGAHDLGLALTLAFASSMALLGAMWGSPVFVAAGVLVLRAHRQAGWRMLLAGVVLSVPVVVSMWW